MLESNHFTLVLSSRSPVMKGEMNQSYCLLPGRQLTMKSLSHQEVNPIKMASVAKTQCEKQKSGIEPGQQIKG